MKSLVSSFTTTPLGFARSFGMRLANGERREWIKPIMFSGGLGSVEDTHVKKEEAQPGESNQFQSYIYFCIDQ